MKPISTYTVVPKLPKKMMKIKEIAYNLWWAWNNDAIDLFRRLDSDLWEESNHNPVKMLSTISQKVLEEKSSDDGFLEHLRNIVKKFEHYIKEKTWYEKNFGKQDSPRIAYFSAEFGLTECIPIYSGGLGILAGDHLKSASDLGIPLVGVGLLYQKGYFRQYLNNDGWQGELYPINDFYNLPLVLVKNEEGKPLMVGVSFPGRTVWAQIWKVNVGRISLYLLDTNIPVNSIEDQDITDELYGGDNEMRIKQELILGIGGVRALHKLGIHPQVYHMNEGHSAFLALERIRSYIEEKGLSFYEALEATKTGNIFTTHTPVPAGIDLFPIDLMKKYFLDYCNQLKISWDEFLKLGVETNSGQEKMFSMAILAIRTASYINGVSKLHGVVSRNMFHYLWPQVPVDEVPITSITNGVHHRSWISKDMSGLYDRYLGPKWLGDPSDQTVWERVEQIPDEELWRTHERRRERLVAFTRRRLKEQLRRVGAPESEILQAEVVLNPDALTIGFARRFATYKRADLLLRDPERLAKIVSNEERPVQIIFSGKAHPKDIPGKNLIRELVKIARRGEFRRHIVFLEDYNMIISRYLVQGVDLWLNTPKRLYEASGTSGMKASANGVINMSILDGWWDEAYKPGIGWAIGKDIEYDDIEYQYDVESKAIYDILEKEVIPLFYDRGADRLPRKWIKLMKNSLTSICPVFNTNRMVCEYTERFYNDALKKYYLVNKDNMKIAREMAAWKENLKREWSKITIKKVITKSPEELPVGSKVEIEAEIFLGTVQHKDVSVEIYSGTIDHKGQIDNGKSFPMILSEQLEGGNYIFKGSIPCKMSGVHGFSVRILPKNDHLVNPVEMGLILWASQ
ncbi:alpha-glucan phosphorylase [candidate division KSB1 bacterium]|nr:MAG: alpha-glucan phosphorylase [candidate division KSB1 bacterium]